MTKAKKRNQRKRETRAHRPSDFNGTTPSWREIFILYTETSTVCTCKTRSPENEQDYSHPIWVTVHTYKRSHAQRALSSFISSLDHRVSLVGESSVSPSPHRPLSDRSGLRLAMCEAVDNASANHMDIYTINAPDRG